jgi:putative DNA primase/helicase
MHAPLNDDDLASADIVIDEAIARGADADAVKKLVGLTGLDYVRQLGPAAKDLGVPAGQLDRIIKAIKAAQQSVSSAIDELPHWKVEPWTDPVDGAALLDEIAGFFSRHVVLPKHGATALALWCMHTWTFNASDISPFLALKSPVKRCGKTTVLIILQYLTRKSELASNISPSAIFRYIEEACPTLLIDEADTFVNTNEEMRGILNSGHTRSAANTIRNVEVGGEIRPRRFSTWAPKAIAGIGSLVDTLEDRSIILTLQRTGPGQKVVRLRRRDSSNFERVRRKASRWADDNLRGLEEADAADSVNVPEMSNDRAVDNWRPLLAIAELSGGAWPEKARQAALALSGEDPGAGSLGVRLLADIRDAFKSGEEGIFTKTLIERLTADPEKPWADYKNGKALGPKHIGDLLRPFCITSETVRPNEAGITDPGVKDAKGYKRVRFEEAWTSYLSVQDPSSPHSEVSDPSTRRSDCGTGTSDDFSKRPEGKPGRIEKMQEMPAAQGLRRLDGYKGPKSGETILDPQGDPICAHCGRGGGDLRELAWGDEWMRLHATCIDPFLAAAPSVPDSPSTAPKAIPSVPLIKGIGQTNGSTAGLKGLKGRLMQSISDLRGGREADVDEFLRGAGWAT